MGTPQRPDNLKPKAPPGLSVLDTAPPQEVLRSNLELRRRTSVLLLSLLSAVLLGVSFAPFDCWFAGYVALVPWALAMAGGVRRGWTIFFGWASGLVFWAGMLYWLALPTVEGYVGGVLYLSLYGLLASALVRATMRRRWPMWITLPVIWVALEFLRARFPLLGFPWFFLAQSQYEQPRLLQIADVTGQYGVSFFVAMVNGAVVDLLYSPLFVRVRGQVRLATHIFTGLVVTALTAAGLLFYGSYRLSQFDRATAPGPTVGIVQEAFPLSLTGPFTPPQTILDAHLRRSMELLGAGCDVVLWPETMLPPGLNRAMLEMDVHSLDNGQVRSLAACMIGPVEARKHSPETLRRSMAGWVGAEPIEPYRAAAVRYMLGRFVTPEDIRALPEATACALARRLFGPESVEGRPAERITREARRCPAEPSSRDEKRLRTLRGRVCLVETCSLLLGCPILAGGTTYHRNPQPTGGSDSWVLENSALWYDAAGPSDVEYAKMLLVPFSEYVPGKTDWPGLYALLRRCVPEIMPQLNPGESLTRFALRRGERTWQLVTPICFEGTFARLCRRMVRAGAKDRLVLVNLSNDGWFVSRRREGSGHGTTEQAQHLAHSVFRAVELRVPVVRAVNTGISAIVRSDGRIESVLEFQLEEYRKRTMIAGAVRGKVLVDSRESLYSLYGDVFAFVISAAAVGMLTLLVWMKRTARKGTKPRCA